MLRGFILRWLLLSAATVVVVAAVIAKEYMVRSSTAEEPIAAIDGEVITRQDLIEYLNILPQEYRKLLKTDSGLKRLVDYYIERKILLQHARESISADDPLLKSHIFADDRDSAYIVAFVRKAIFENVKVTERELKEYMKANGLTSEAMARAMLVADRRQQMYRELIKQLRSQHKIEYFITGRGG